MESTAAQRAALDKITAQIAAAAGPALPGTLIVRAHACGKPNCRCHADPPRLHGPYAEWTRKIGGKTVTRRLTPRQLAEYQPLFDNAKKLRALVNELQDLTLQIIEADSPRQHHSPEPETRGPENAGEARLTCGQPPSQTPFAQVRPKREDVSVSAVQRPVPIMELASSRLGAAVKCSNHLARAWPSKTGFGALTCSDDLYRPSCR